MEEDKRKQLNLYKNLGAILISKGEWFLAKAHNVKYTQTISSATLKNFLVGLGLTNIYTADNKYRLADWKVWQSIIKYDWTDKRKYLSDFFDCDDYANAFKSRMSEIYKLNSVALARSTILYDRNTKKKVGVHRHNIIVATSNGILQAYAFEAQTDEWQLIQKGRPIEMGNWQYQIKYLDF